MYNNSAIITPIFTKLYVKLVLSKQNEMIQLDCCSVHFAKPVTQWTNNEELLIRNYLNRKPTNLVTARYQQPELRMLVKTRISITALFLFFITSIATSIVDSGF